MSFNQSILDKKFYKAIKVVEEEKLNERKISKKELTSNCIKRNEEIADVIDQMFKNPKVLKPKVKVLKLIKK